MSDMSPWSNGGMSTNYAASPGKAAVGLVAPVSLLLQRCFGLGDARWSDALIVRMRRHIGGCVNSTDAELRLELERIVGINARTIEGALPASASWFSLRGKPYLLDEDLVRHFRDRAAVSLMAQQDPSGARQGVQPRSSNMFPQAIADCLDRLFLAQKEWADTSPDELPMRADLPAEFMESLVWTVLAIIAERLNTAGIMDRVAVLKLCDRAGQALLSRYDEQATPYIAATLMAHRLRQNNPGEEHLLWLARNGHVIALLAILANRCGIDMRHLVAMVVEGQEYLLFQLCRSADFPREVAVRLMLGRKAVSSGAEDSVLIQYADHYERMPRNEVVHAAAPFGVSDGFRAKLFALRDGAGK